MVSFKPKGHGKSILVWKKKWNLEKKEAQMCITFSVSSIVKSYLFKKKINKWWIWHLNVKTRLSFVYAVTYAKDLLMIDMRLWNGRACVNCRLFAHACGHFKVPNEEISFLNIRFFCICGFFRMRAVFGRIMQIFAYANAAIILDYMRPKK